MSETPSIAVVGAGPGGVSAAMLLAASGARVTLFEKDDRVGGRSARITLQDGDERAFHFDTGPTFYLMPYVLDEIFAAAGERLADHVELTRLDPMYRLLVGQPGKEPLSIDATQDIQEMARRIGAVNKADGEAFARFISDQRTKLRLSEPILRRPITNPFDLIDLETAKVLPHLKPHRTVHSLLGDYFTDERVKLAVSFQSKYLGMSPFECPSLFTILPLIEYEYGVWHPTGGCNAIWTAMTEQVARMGVDIRLNAPVDEITFTGSRADGVVSGGQREAFDAVFVNADASWAIKNLIPESKRTGGNGRYSDASMDSKRYSCSTYMLYLGLEGELDHLPHHTIYTSSKYRENLDDISNLGRLSEDPSVYVCNPSRLDRSLSPEGTSAAYVLAPTPNVRGGTKPGERSAIDWDGTDGDNFRERVLDQLERVFKIDSVRSRILTERAISPLDWQRMNINFGATFNLAHNLKQMLHWRPQNKLKGYDRLYLVGGGTHPGSGLPTIFLSSQISSRLACDDLGLTCALDEPRSMSERAQELAAV